MKRQGPRVIQGGYKGDTRVRGSEDPRGRGENLGFEGRRFEGLEGKGRVRGSKGDTRVGGEGQGSRVRGGYKGWRGRPGFEGSYRQ